MDRKTQFRNAKTAPCLAFREINLLRPRIIYFIFPNGIRNGIINFCSVFLDERVLVRDVEHTSRIGEIIISYIIFICLNEHKNFLFKNSTVVKIYFNL